MLWWAMLVALARAGGHQMIEFISQCYGPEQAVQAARFASHSKLKVAFNN